jgi:hypothetical protein
MKMMRTLLVVACLAGSEMAASASPFLVCDPVPGNLDQFTKPVSYVITGLSGTPLSTPATVNQDGTVQLHYDLSALGNGTYTVTAAAVNVLGGVSPATGPFLFRKRGASHPH